jgi:hypothetical protein
VNVPSMYSISAAPPSRVGEAPADVVVATDPASADADCDNGAGVSHQGEGRW